MIAILDYGLGNLGSISNMLKVIGEKSKITNDTNIIESADGIILPGVGAFDASDPGGQFLWHECPSAVPGQGVGMVQPACLHACTGRGCIVYFPAEENALIFLPEPL